MVQTDNSQSHWFSLSKYILWFFYNFYEEIVKESFNTSHVTLYQSAGRPGIPRCRVSIHHMLLFIVIAYAADGITKLFQYITCYSLSHSENIHCIDVVLFQYITCYSLSAAGKTQAKMFPGFNTSHVTLYPYRRNKESNRKTVSIHHMLLFIRIQGVSILHTVSVSIHHMLLFIRNREADDILAESFNTSHVTLYR